MLVVKAFFFPYDFFFPCILDILGEKMHHHLAHQKFTKHFRKVPKMEESSNLYKLYGYGLWIRENPPPKQPASGFLHFRSRYLKLFDQKNPLPTAENPWKFCRLGFQGSLDGTQLIVKANTLVLWKIHHE